MNGATGGVTLNTVTFASNSAASYGGAVYVSFKPTAMINVVFKSNTAVRSMHGLKLNFDTYLN